MLYAFECWLAVSFQNLLIFVAFLFPFVLSFCPHSFSCAFCLLDRKVCGHRRFIPLYLVHIDRSTSTGPHRLDLSTRTVKEEAQS